MNITPINRQVLVEPSVEPVKKSGIYIVRTGDKQPTEGKIVAIAEDVDEVKVGQTVGMKEWAALYVSELLGKPDTRVLIDVQDLLYIK